MSLSDYNWRANTKRYSDCVEVGLSFQMNCIWLTVIYTSDQQMGANSLESIDLPEQNLQACRLMEDNTKHKYIEIHRIITWAADW